jgi:hypothetical protein
MFDSFLKQHDGADWARVRAALLLGEAGLG